MSLVIPAFSLPTFRAPEGTLLVMDPVRKKKVKASPEEYVRQQIIAYLHHRLGFPYGLMQVEQSVVINGRKKRFDISAYDRDARIVLLVECKRPEVALNRNAFLQMANYNSGIRAPYCWLSNGAENLLIHITASGPVELTELPHFNQINESLTA